VPVEDLSAMAIPLRQTTANRSSYAGNRFDRGGFRHVKDFLDPNYRQGECSMLIAEVQKNMKEHIRVSVEEYRGSTFIDLRVYWQDEQGEWRPSKKGIALNGGGINEVIMALQSAAKKLEG
jgi:hypothetical protein